MTSDCFISCFYCIIQFGFKKDIRKEKGRFKEHVREEEKTIQKQTNQKYKHNKHKQTNKPKNKLLDVITFQNVLYYAFGEYIFWYEGQKNHSFVKFIF